MGSVRTTQSVVNIGDKFGRLTVIGNPFYCRVGSAFKRMQHVVCECDCGTVVAARSSILKIGRLVSCGCYQSETTAARNYKHGYAKRNAKTPYGQWCHMRERCLDNRGNYWHRYGGRGISICSEWIDSPEKFCEWAYANGWEVGKTLDRIDNDGNYEPSNCRFVTPQQNTRNRSNSIVLTHKGKTQTIDDWARELGVTRERIHGRLYRGGTIDHALGNRS